jgi:hypothetical protein
MIEDLTHDRRSHTLTPHCRLRSFRSTPLSVLRRLPLTISCILSHTYTPHLHVMTEQIIMTLIDRAGGPLRSLIAVCPSAGVELRQHLDKREGTPGFLELCRCLDKFGKDIDKALTSLDKWAEDSKELTEIRDALLTLLGPVQKAASNGVKTIDDYEESLLAIRRKELANVATPIAATQGFIGEDVKQYLDEGPPTKKHKGGVRLSREGDDVKWDALPDALPGALPDALPPHTPPAVQYETTD